MILKTILKKSSLRWFLKSSFLLSPIHKLHNYSRTSLNHLLSIFNQTCSELSSPHDSEKQINYQHRNTCISLCIYVRYNTHISIYIYISCTYISAFLYTSIYIQVFVYFTHTHSIPKFCITKTYKMDQQSNSP